MEDYIIEMLNITKEFSGVKANDDITLKLRRGEIHALLGENGAGKSTLMSILFGLYTPTSGEIKKNGKTVRIKNPNEATALGIGMVHQHFKLVEIFTVLQNIILGCEPTKGGILSLSGARQKVMELSEKYNLKVDPDAKIEDISVGMQQRVEILKMLFRENEVLIFDEPTAVLTPQEIEELMKIMKKLAAEGKSILFITHKLNEIMEVADRCTILRKGKYEGTVEIKNTTKEELSSLMVGREVKFKVDKKKAEPGEEILRVDKLDVLDKRTGKKAVDDVSFCVKSGEIVGIAGIDGNGQSELINAITGLGPLNGGTIMLCGTDVTKKNIRFKNTHGLSHIPEDRQKHGLVLEYSIEENMILQRYFEEPFSRKGFLNKNAMKEYSQKLSEEYDVRSLGGGTDRAGALSGGNQQKIIIARENDREHSLLVAALPTRGLDVGAIEYIHKSIVKSRDEGKAVLLLSFELEEILGLSDRILVMYEGQITGELDPENITRSEIGLYMSGAKRNINSKEEKA